MTCRNCKNWTMKHNAQMARQGFGNCNLQLSRAVLYPPHHTCNAHKPVTAEDLAKRNKFLLGVRL